MDPIATRGPRLALCRLKFRDHSEVDRPIAVEALLHVEVVIDELISRFVIFDPADINSAFAELTARWIATGEVAHPNVIEREHSLVEAANRLIGKLSPKSALAQRMSITDNWLPTGSTQLPLTCRRSRRWPRSCPTCGWNFAEVLAHSASVAVTHLIVKGTSTDGVEIELPIFVLNVHDGEHVTHMETFDVDQRDMAVARFEELGRSN